MYIFFWTPYVFTTVFGFYTAPVGLKNLLDYLSHHKVPVQIHENSHLTLCDPPEKSFHQEGFIFASIIFASNISSLLQIYTQHHSGYMRIGQTKCI